MKVSLNWAQQYSNVDLKSVPKEELLEKIGQQLAAVEEVIEWGPRFDGIVVAKVVSCIPHPNADKLHVCRIDDGKVTADVERDENDHVEVVCGAPNVKEGMFVAWLPPGSTVPSTRDKDPFVLTARDLRGVVSNGMLASPAELGLSDNHEGILEIIPEEAGEELARPGTPFKQLYGLDDTVYDLENKMFTHRPDCFGILGVARELAGITQQKYVSPDWYRHAPVFKVEHDIQLKVEVSTELVPRFIGVVMQNVTIAPSPVFLQAGLTRVGIRPISNIVDITNWMMHLTGQPMHAYDYDKILARSGGDTATLEARLSKKGEKIALLNGKTAELDDKTIVIATDKEVVGIGGVMGGAGTEVDEHTKTIILEAASFDMFSIRKTAMKYGLFTDAVARFNKGQSPLQNDRVMAEAMRMVVEHAKANQASSVVDYKDASVKEMPVVNASVDFINSRLGSSLKLGEMQKLLENVECGGASGGASESRSYLKGVGAIDNKLTRIGVKIVEKTEAGDYKLLIPAGTESEYEKIVSWEMKPGYWNEYIGAKNVFMFKDPDTKVSRYEVSDDNEHEIIEMCRTYANDYYTSIEAMLANTDWYKPLLPLNRSRRNDMAEADTISVSPPFWRRDLELPEDLVEEIGRLYGYDKLPVALPKRPSKPAARNPEFEFAGRLRRILAAGGANEVLTYSFVPEKLLVQAGQNVEDAYQIRNAISPDLQYYRLSLTPSLLDKVHMNSKAGNDRFALFEIGVTHSKKETDEATKLPIETSILALTFVNRSTAKGVGAPYFGAITYLNFLAAKLGISFNYKPIDTPPDSAVIAPFEISRAAFVYIEGTDVIAGIVGEYHAGVRTALKLPDYAAGFEIGLTELQSNLPTSSRYKPLARFPKSQQDITFEVAADVLHGRLTESLEKAAAAQQQEHGYECELSPGDIYVPESGEHKRITFHLSLNHPDRTLTTEEFNKFLEELAKQAANDHAAKRI